METDSVNGAGTALPEAGEVFRSRLFSGLKIFCNKFDLILHSFVHEREKLSLNLFKQTVSAGRAIQFVGWDFSIRKSCIQN